MLITYACGGLVAVSDSCNPMDFSLPGSSVYGILQTVIVEWVAISFSRGSSQPQNQTWVSCIAGRFFTNGATRKAPKRGHCGCMGWENALEKGIATLGLPRVSNNILK